jgi:PhzF family phenazine biosynthesis protein
VTGAPVPIHVVDSFTERPFAGNPAAVCLLDEPAPDAWMRSLAAEMRHSETAFVVRGASPDGAFGLRWFTPTVEVDLCGHATLASAHVLWAHGGADEGHELTFDTRSGRLGARRQGDWIVLDFPATPVVPADAPDGMIAALGLQPRDVRTVGRSRFDYVVEVSEGATVRALAPDFPALGRVPARGVAVTAPGDEPGVDFVSRFFGPASGIDEDPVTGSAHCALGPYWADRTGRSTLVARQVSPRGGTVRVEVSGARVALGGRAVTVLSGAVRAVPV